MTLLTNRGNMRIFVVFNENKSAISLLDIVAEQGYNGKLVFVDRQSRPGRFICHFDIPGNDEPGSMPGRFCKFACDFLDELKLEPKFGLSDYDSQIWP